MDFCLETGRDELLSQWDEHLNGPLTAADITYGSKRKVWWRCAKVARMAGVGGLPDNQGHRLPCLRRQTGVSRRK
ncbi:MAG: zinc-ribbon domain-containing protein [Lachnospiraceae bacterium]